jgi:predicted nucleotidyltransferase
MNGVDEPIKTTLIDVVDLLEQQSVRYVLIGALAASLRGQPRVTADVDLVIRADVARALRLISSLATSRFEPLLPDVEEVVKRSLIVPLRHRYTGVKVDMALGLSGFEQQLIDRAEDVTIAGLSIRVATAEDLLLMKVLARRPRDDQDIHGIIAARGATMDWDYCRRVARDLGEALSQDLLTRIQDLSSHVHEDEA